MSAPVSSVDDSLAKRNVTVLVALQALLGSQMPMYFIVAGLVGQQLAPIACLATLPISLIVFGSMMTAPWLSATMQRFGRRTGFVIGAIGGVVGAGLSAYAIMLDSFWLFLAGSGISGIYMSAQGFYRFAAADTASESFRPKAISYVMAGGLISAIVGPQIVNLMTVGNPDARATLYVPVYLAIVVLNLVGMLLFTALNLPKPPKPKDGAAPNIRSRAELLRTPKVVVAIICATVTYALMNLVMTSTPLAVVGCGYAVADASNVVSAHVLAMFAPSFFTGHLIARFGAERIVAAGLMILAGAGAVALSGVELTQFFGALILLGLGWNFGFIGSTAMLASAHSQEERGRVQGLNDLIVFGGVTMASLASGGLMNCVGTDPVAGWSAVNYAMAPFLMVAGGALLWLMLRPKAAAA